MSSPGMYNILAGKVVAGQCSFFCIVNNDLVETRGHPRGHARHQTRSNCTFIFVLHCSKRIRVLNEDK